MRIARCTAVNGSAELLRGCASNIVPKAVKTSSVALIYRWAWVGYSNRQP